MKCKKKNPHCKPILFVKANGDNFICSGVSNKPTKYINDKIWLCLSGQLTKNTELEMTRDEALMIISALSLSCADDIVLEQRKTI